MFIFPLLLSINIINLMPKHKVGQEDRIKYYLQSLADQEEFSSTTRRFNHRVTKSFMGQTSFNELSDWNNTKQLTGLESGSLPKLVKQQKIRIQSDIQENLSRYQSQLLRTVRDKKSSDNSVHVSPKIYEFNSRIFSKTPKKSKLFFHKVLHLDEQKKLEQTLRLKGSKGSWPKQVEEGQSKVEEPVFVYPKVERSGILRMLKRREQIKIYRKKKTSPDVLKGIKFGY